ncbi:DegV family protein [Chengkuizengella axinellae]|uniref:DegV family protein n=1 Tax=Chengkuizengella axinellae TaxID=3064388 RepID=A0ABT9J2Y6_9BACL|nr:DegV family protein [Chengkuizengella sp. 2205SS18-9]MDP5275980.1 DegV family protein [Chengkuizengella sp. 2205SS18-9]
MAIRVVTDSTSYIPEKIQKQYDITVVPLSVTFEDESFKETDVSSEYFYNKLAKSNALPTSSQPSVHDLYSIFENLVKQNHDIVAIFISSEMSGAYSTALLASNMILEKHPNASIEIIDSGSTSMQLGFAALAAAKEAAVGNCIRDVVEAAINNMKRSRFIFIPETLEYLKKGGRIGSAKALLSSVLKIKPILTVSDGKTNVIDKIRTKKRAVTKMTNVFYDNIKTFGLGDVIVHHIQNEEEAKSLAETIKEIAGKKVQICPIGPVVGTHVGPGAIGITYYTEKELLI